MDSFPGGYIQTPSTWILENALPGGPSVPGHRACAGIPVVGTLLQQ